MSCIYTKNSRPFYGFLLAIVFSLFSVNAMADTASQDFSASGYDDDPVVLTVSASDITVNNNGDINAVTLSVASLGNSNYCDSWYSFTLTVDGEVIIDGGCGSDMESVDLTGFTSFSITSATTDGYSDPIAMSVSISVDYTPLVGGGCINVAACNYDSTATADDGSCTYPSAAYLDCDGELLDEAGCTEISACNYDSTASIDDESCSYPSAVYLDCDGELLAEAGCTEVSACNYDSTATIDDESCSYPSAVYLDCDGELLAEAGCTDSLATNYDDSASIDDESCVYPVFGCTNLLANNYDALADTDNGSCLFCVAGVELDSLPANTIPDEQIFVNINLASYASEASWQLSFNGEVIMSDNYSYSDNYESYTYKSSLEYGCLSSGCYKFEAFDSYGDGWNGGSYSITDQYGTILLCAITTDIDFTGAEAEEIDGVQTMTNRFSIGDTECLIAGCTDPIAANYNECATVNDGCTYCPEGTNDVSVSFSQESSYDGGGVLLFNDSDTLFSALSVPSFNVAESDLCLPVGCYSFAMFADDTDGWDDNSVAYIYDPVTLQNVPFRLDSGAMTLYQTISIGDTTCEEVYFAGCIDSIALNYSASATYNDGSCEYVEGCSDSTALNYDAAVTLDDGSCYGPGGACEASLIDVPSITDSVNYSFGNWVELTADPAGFGAQVTFDGVGGTSSFTSYWVVSTLNCDSATSTRNISGLEIDLEAGQTLYFQAYDYYGYVESYFGDVEPLVISASLLENPDTNLIQGCMNPMACNYDSTAQVDDYSCSLPDFGKNCDGSCIDENANNYPFDMSSPQYGDGFYGAEYTISLDGEVVATGPSNTGSWYSSTDSIYCLADGCYDVVVTTNGYDSYYEWTFGDASGNTGESALASIGENGCTSGCLDTLAINYDATVNFSVDSLCEYDLLPGCMNPIACNYDSTAEVDNGSCQLAEEGFDCEGNCLEGIASSVVMVSPVYADGFYGAEYTISLDGEVIATGPSNTGSWYTTTDDLGCLVEGCYDIVVTSNGYDASYVWGFGDAAGNTGESAMVSIGENGCISGCADSTATNYNPDADIADGSCEYDFVVGCTDATSYNYNPDAVYDDGSCLVQGTIVTLPYSGSELTNCNNGDSLNGDNTSYTGYYMSGEDALFEFSVADSGSVSIDLSNSSDTYTGIIVFDGNPLLGSNVVASSTSSSYNQSITSMAVDTGISYFVIIDTYAAPNCIANFDLSIVQDVYGCMNSNADNYDSLANVSVDSICEFSIVQGCIDESACNFDELAGQDDGSCYYPGDECDCPGTGLTSVTDSADYSYGDWLVVTADPNGFGAVLTFEGSGGYSTYTYYGVSSTFDCDSATSIANAPTIEMELEAGQSLYFQAYDYYGYVIGSSSWLDPNDTVPVVVTAVLTENPDTNLIQGCTDIDACNYDSTAQYDDLSCTYPLFGEDCDGNCLVGDPVEIIFTDNGSYNSECSWSISDLSGTVLASAGSQAAGTDTSSFCGIDMAECLILTLFDGYSDGWSGSGGLNHTLTVDGVEYTFEPYSGTSDATLPSNADNYVTFNLGICTYGCKDSLAENYNPNYNFGVDSLCTYNLVQGCMNVDACNYDPLAEQDNGSCQLPEEGFDCDGNCADGSNLEIIFTDNGSYNSECSWSISDLSGTVLASAGSQSAGTDTTIFCGIDMSQCLTLTLFDAYSDGWGGSFGLNHTLTVNGAEYTFEPYSGTSDATLPSNADNYVTIAIGSGCVVGCMDTLAMNYDSLANVSSDCIYPVPGCTDITALNYDPLANVDDSTCIPCTDNSLVLNMYDAYSDGWDDGTFSMTYGSNSYTTTLDDGAEATEYLCIPTGCYDIVVGGSDYNVEISFGIEGIIDSTVIQNADEFNSEEGFATFSSIEIGVGGCTAGCMDTLALNYDPAAYVNEGCIYPLTVDFSINMNDVDQPSADYDNVVINGSWNGWNGWGVELSDDDADGVWTGSGEFDPSIGQFEYKVAVTGPADDYSGWGISWGDGCANSNFLLIFEEGVDSYSVSHTIGCEPLPATVFNVDMNCADVPFTTVHLTGPTWGWTTDIIMTDEDGDGVYSITMENLDGDYEYKYMLDYWGSQEDLIPSMLDGGDCAPLTDYSTYANRQVASGSTTSDTYSSCTECSDDILGCTDSTAANYNALATIDDESCDYCQLATVNFSVNAGDVVSEEYDNVVINGSFASWNGWGVTLTDEDGDGVYTGTAQVGAGVHQYVHALTGSADGWSGWGVTGFAPEACALGIDTATGDTAPNYYFTAECGEVIDLPTVCFGECSDCSEAVLGCTDASADNYDPTATEDDNSCTYCNNFDVLLIGTSNTSAAGAADGNVQATGVGGSSNYSVNVFDLNDVPQNPFALSAGDYVVVVTDLSSDCEASENITISDPVVADNPCDIVPSGLFVDNIIHNRVVFNWSSPSAAPSYYMIRYRAVGTSGWTVMRAGPETANEFSGTSRTRYFHEPSTTYEWSMRARVVGDDLSTTCQSPWSASSQYTTLAECANLENLSVSTEANWVSFSADAPDASWGVWQSKGKMRTVGTNSFRYVNGSSDGSISGLKGNFDASTDYEWHTKAWCTGNVDSDGNSDVMYHSGWGDFSSFTTEAPCDKMPTNLTTSTNGANTAVTMTWDTPESGAPDHYFLEMTNETTGQVFQWNNISGSSNSKTKFGQNPGDNISWRIRGACGANGTSWATIFSQPATFTLGGARLENSSLANLDVYPNPSRDIFNVTFTSEEAQTMTVKVVNMIGEEIFTEELTEFVGQYTQVIDMNTQPKGVYFLEITTSTGGINKKIVLQ